MDGGTLSERLNLHEAAELAGCHPDTLRRLMKERLAPGAKIGRGWIVTRSVFGQWLDGDIDPRPQLPSTRWRPRAPSLSDAALMRAVEKVATFLGTDSAEFSPELPVRSGHTPNFHVAKRRAAKLQRTPAWADMEAIAAIYRECRRLTKSTGVKHEVDHVIPLQGRTVSGLHVHQNLRIVTRAENLRKHNTYVENETP